MIDVDDDDSFLFSIGKIEDCNSENQCFGNNQMHQHHHYILYYIKEGSGHHNIDFQNIEIKANRLFFISPGQTHRLYSDAISGYYIIFDLDFYHSIKSNYKLYDFPFFHTTISLPYLDLENSTTKISNFLNRMYEEYTNTSTFGKKAILRMQLEILFILLTRIAQEEYVENEAILVPNNDKLRKLELLIEQNFKTQKSINFYAQNLNISSRHLNNIISSKTGKSISVMLQERVIMESKRLLLHSEKTVAEIAYELGFNDKAYFHRYFKKHVNKTPLEFRADFLKVH